ncbi:NUDIX hydrolase [Krasilnikovia sp. M28-CT-15]|uniref:NUDIX hydrolase n=1 Tax=Krasilnikovia sp. M28-CT-15 TaxID=3373540 RepID=UPI003876BA24
MRVPTKDGQLPVAAAVIVDRRRVLLIRRRVQEGRLSWQFPAGKIEPDESACEAAVREAREETGLAVTAVGSLGERVHPDTGRTMHYIRCAIEGGTTIAANEEEVAAVAWCNRADLSTYVPYPIFAPVQEFLDNELC